MKKTRKTCPHPAAERLRKPTAALRKAIGKPRKPIFSLCEAIVRLRKPTVNLRKATVKMSGATEQLHGATVKPREATGKPAEATCGASEAVDKPFTAPNARNLPDKRLIQLSKRLFCRSALAFWAFFVTSSITGKLIFAV